MQPLVSIVMPVLNGVAAGPGYLWMAIDSLVHQDYDGPIEILLIDDGSSDDTVAMAQVWADQVKQSRQSRRLRVVARKHEGVTRALNAGINRADGEFVARHDADDFSDATRIRKQVAYLSNNPEVAMVGSAAKLYHGARDRGEVWFRWKESRIPLDAFAKNSPFCHGSVMFRASVLKEVGGYDPQFPHAQDYDLFWRIAKKWPVASIPEPLYCYRVHDKRVTSNPRRFRIQLDCSRAIQRRIARELQALCLNK